MAIKRNKPTQETKKQMSSAMSEALATIQQAENIEPMQVVAPVMKEPEVLPQVTETEDGGVVDANTGEILKRGRKSSTEGKDNVFNTSLDDCTAWRVKYIKDRMNRARKKGDAYVSVNALLYQALVQWLDQKYPETKDAYEKMAELGLLD